MKFKVSHDSGIKQFFGMVFLYLGINILASGSIAYVLARNIEHILFLYQNFLMFCVGYMFLFFVIISSLQNSLSNNNSSILENIFLLTAFLTLEAVGFVPFLIIYTAESVLIALGMTSAIFFCLSFFGLKTSVDLSSYANTAMIGIFFITLFEICSFLFGFPINIRITSLAVIGSMCFIIPYNLQKLKQLYTYHDSYLNETKLALLGSVILFVDFMILLQRILILIGDRKQK